MSRKIPEISLPVVTDRNFPIEVFAKALQAVEATGVVDSFQMWDQMTGWNPPCLWTPERTAAAKVYPDHDSFPDWFPMTGYAAAVAPELGSVISLDSLRRLPAELVQTMMTMANISKGKATYHIGAGEFKQAQPFGHNIKQKIGRQEDFYKIFDAFRSNNKTPISYQGKYTTLDHAWLGIARNYQPRIWGLGGGPKIIDLATSYADGFATMAQLVWSDPEDAAKQIKAIKETLEKKGRDPEAFGFGIYCCCLLHEDEAVVDRALDHDLMRWHTTIWGRINQGDWEKEGLPPPMPKDWHYANNLLPIKVELPEALEMIGRATRKHIERSWLWGSPKKVAAEIQAFVDAGVTWVGVADMLPTTGLTVEEPGTAVFERSVEVCRLLKQGGS